MKSETILPKVLRVFFLSLLIATIGTYVGTFVPPALFIPLLVIELIMILVIVFVRKRKLVGYGFLYVFTFLSGVTTYPVVKHYADLAGANVVIAAFVATTVIFGALSLYAWKSKRDFRPLFGFLFAALLGLILLAVINLFFPFPDTMMIAYGALGIVIFSGWVLYDISVMRFEDFEEEDVPLLALNLYLDFINLFYSLLRFLGYLK